MIWVRRVFAIPLILLFVPLLLAILVVLRVNGTVLSADFYIDQLRKADIFNFFYDNIVPSALDEVMPKPEDLPVDRDVLKKELLSFVREALPPDWLQEQTENAIGQVVPYLVGDADTFSITIPVSQRLEAAAPALKKGLAGSGVYNVFSTKQFSDVVEKNLKGQFSGLPLGLTLTTAQMVTAVQDVMPPDWVQARAESLIDEIVPYAAGKKQEFKIVVPLSDRVEAMAPVLKRLLREAGAYDQVYKEQIAPLIAEQGINTAGGSAIRIPVTATVRIEITKDSLRAALQKVPPQVLQKQVEGVIDDFTPYLSGRAEHFELKLNVSDATQLAVPIIEGLVKEQLKKQYDSLSPCSLNDVLSLATKGIQGDIPLCRPPGFTIAQAQQALGIPAPALSRDLLEKACACDLGLLLEPLTFEKLLSLLGVDIAKEVKRAVESVVPATVTYTDTDLRKLLGQEQKDILDNLLDWTRNGFTYSDADLRKTIGKDNEATLDQALKITREGVTFTDSDLRDALSKAGQSSQDFDLVHKWLGLARKLSFLLYLPPAIFLAGIAFLGGRSWPSRLAWAAVPLIFTAGIAFAAFGPAYRGFAEPLLDDALADSVAQTTQTAVEKLATDKAIAVAKTVINDFIGGLEKGSLLFLGIGIAALVLAILLPRLSRKPKTTQPAQT